MPGTVRDLMDREFGQLKVIAFAGLSGPSARGNRKALWLCRCACGAETVISGNALQDPRKKVISCGCAKRERGRAAMTGARGQALHAKLASPVWDRICRVCGAAFTGTARQIYCRECKPKVLAEARRRYVARRRQKSG